MAYRAGAELRSLEIQLWHVSDLAYPKSWMRVHVYPNPMPDTEETTRLYNSKGGLIYELKSMDPGKTQVAPYHLQMRRLIQHVMEKPNSSETITQVTLTLTRHISIALKIILCRFHSTRELRGTGREMASNAELLGT
jgi:succinate dehydrogenase/fumarate reductase flavoprotein subunit